MDKSLEARPSSFHDVMVTIKGPRAIPRTALPCSRGSIPSSVSVIGQQAVRKSVVEWTDGTLCNAVTTHEGQSHVVGVRIIL